MTVTRINNDNEETIVGILEKKSQDKIVLLVHGEQGNISTFLYDAFDALY